MFIFRPKIYRTQQKITRAVLGKFYMSDRGSLLWGSLTEKTVLVGCLGMVTHITKAGLLVVLLYVRRSYSNTPKCNT